MSKIKIGIIGYGNIGRGLEAAINAGTDTELTAIFTRRQPNTIKISTKAKVVNISEVEKYKDIIDVMVLCLGSATDLPVQGPEFAKMFNTVDSYDNHSRIPEYIKKVDESASASGKVSIVSMGWDPGLFSMIRMLSEAVLPEGSSHTFWGRGVSQGHSDAIRRIALVKQAVQYTIPVKTAVDLARSGNNIQLTPKDRHNRECYVVCEECADKSTIEAEIKNMPDYFAEYNTKVNFISEDEFKKNHSKMPHGGVVIRNGVTGLKRENKHIMEFSLKLDSNPEFTGSILLAYARAAYRMYNEGMKGAKTIFDIPISYISSKSREELISSLL